MDGSVTQELLTYNPSIWLLWLLEILLVIGLWKKLVILSPFSCQFILAFWQSIRDLNLYSSYNFIFMANLSFLSASLRSFSSCSFSGASILSLILPKKFLFQALVYSLICLKRILMFGDLELLQTLPRLLTVSLSSRQQLKILKGVGPQLQLEVLRTTGLWYEFFVLSVKVTQDPTSAHASLIKTLTYFFYFPVPKNL